MAFKELMELGKYKKIGLDRENYINENSDSSIGLDDSINKLNLQINIDKVSVRIKNVTKLNDNCSCIVVENVNDRRGVIFKPGEYITVTKNIDGEFITRPYLLTSTMKDVRNGEYEFIVFEVENGRMSNYLLNKAVIGDELIISGPYGDFSYNPIRDKKNIIGLCSDKGIVSFISMIRSIFIGDLDVNLKLFCYGDNFILRDELEGICDTNKNISIEYLNEYGFDRVKFCLDKDYSIFISGDEYFLKKCEKDIMELDIPNKFVRYQDYKIISNAKKSKKYIMTVHVLGKIKKCVCYSNKTILEAIEKGKIFVPSRCQNGKCGICKVELISGKVKTINDKRNEYDKEMNYICSCSTYPLGDIVIKVR